MLRPHLRPRLLLSFLPLAALSLFAACTTGTTTSSSGGLGFDEAGSEGGVATEGGSFDEDSGTTTNDSGPSTPDVNPYGVPYPTDSIGTKARAGSKRGDRLSNFSFQGYRPGSTTKVNVALADLYDPQGKTHDVVYVYGGSLWSVYDQKGLDIIKASTKRIATLAVIGEGTSPGDPATSAHLDTWRSKNTFATTAIDSRFAKIGVFFDAGAVPFVMLVDARTMEIVSAGVGAPTQTSEVDAAVTAVTSRAASY